jgi:hypothetical protein
VNAAIVSRWGGKNKNYLQEIIAFDRSILAGVPATGADAFSVNI